MAPIRDISLIFAVEIFGMRKTRTVDSLTRFGTRKHVKGRTYFILK